MFTASGVPCVDCGLDMQACYDSTAGIYCTMGGCKDTACSLQVNASAAAKP